MLLRNIQVGLGNNLLNGCNISGRDCCWIEDIKCGIAYHAVVANVTSAEQLKLHDR